MKSSTVTGLLKTSHRGMVANTVCPAIFACLLSSAPIAGSRTQINKAHKTRFSSKATRQVHKTSRTDKSRISKSERNATKGARAARIQRNKMVGDQKRAALLKEKIASSGSTSPPRVIVC
ncbi:hypothetical protein NE237_016506 [Protea cynaroides]|uniref:Uncharacterized protein n=1 Tax=Protea cynaroides TaxID=273540 RepID=A0A9Q0HDZ0_9MAGN|nr:hypothetical protein NE237_016506 [Protea cynaroides]